jgi:hypothetical protein
LNKKTKSNWILDRDGTEKFPVRADFQTCDKKDAVKREKSQLSYAFGEKRKSFKVSARESLSQSYQLS